LVEQTLSGEGARLKEYTIGLDVFQRRSDYDPQVDSTVRVHAGKLRDKLRVYYLTDGHDSPLRIELPRGSYLPAFRLQTSAPAEPVEGSEGEVAGPVDTLFREIHNGTPSPERPATLPEPVRARRDRKWVLLIAAFTIGVGVGWSIYRMVTRRETGRPKGRALVVLPFRDMSAEKDQEYFCDGITEELINTLAKVDGIRVVARTSAFAFKGKGADIRGNAR
jgi:hypothetical protein